MTMNYSIKNSWYNFAIITILNKELSKEDQVFKTGLDQFGGKFRLRYLCSRVFYNKFCEKRECYNCVHLAKYETGQDVCSLYKAIVNMSK